MSSKIRGFVIYKIITKYHPIKTKINRINQNKIYTQSSNPTKSTFYFHFHKHRSKKKSNANNSCTRKPANNMQHLQTENRLYTINSQFQRRIGNKISEKR